MWKTASICSLPDSVRVAQSVKQDSLHIITSVLLEAQVSFKIKCSEVLMFAGVCSNEIIRMTYGK